MAEETGIIPSPPKLPTFGMTDGEQIIDGNGNIFEYNAEQDEWIYRGQIEEPDIVTWDQDGLVYPSVYRKLLLIQELMDRGIDFGLFKLDTPGDTPYYYFFYSADDLLRFYPETGSRLRVELDRNRLYHKLLRSCCAGPKGPTGSTGDTGRAGVPADDEKFRLPSSVTSGEFDIDTTVETPIETAISTRLFRDETILVEYLLAIDSGSDVVSVNGAGDINLTEEQKQAAELESEARGLAEQGDIDGAIAKLEEIIELVVDVARINSIIDSLNFDGTWPEEQSPLQIIIYDDQIDIDLTGTELNFDRSTNRLWGTLAFTHGADDIADWRYKARQRGPKGKDGNDGSPFVEISSQVLDDPQIRSSEAVVSLRKSDLTNQLTYLSDTLPSDVCVSNLSLSAGALPVGDILSAKFASAKLTTRRCKDIGFYEYNSSPVGVAAAAYVHPPLELPAWEPTGDCLTAARFSAYKFEWWDLTDPKYPFRIFVPPRPNEQCCQEPFFWCPNVGDNPCGVNHWRCGGLETLPSGVADAQGLSCDGSAKEPILKPPSPKAPDCDCDCESPISFELQNGGMSYGTVNLGPTQGQQSYSNGDASVIDTRVETYKVNFKASGPVEIVVELMWEPIVCGGQDVEIENCQYREDCEVHTTIIFEDNNSNATISGGGASELSAIPSNASFIVTPLSGTNIDVVLNVMVNDTQSQCCRGYEIRIGAVYIGDDITQAQVGQTDVIVVDGDFVPL